MSCPGRRVRSQSPNTFPRDTGPHKSPSPRWTGQRHPRSTEAPQVAAPGRWPSEALPPAGPTRRSREHGEYMSVGGTTVPIPPICQPLPPFPGMVAAKAELGTQQGLARKQEPCVGLCFPSRPRQRAWGWRLCRARAAERGLAIALAPRPSCCSEMTDLAAERPWEPSW